MHRCFQRERQAGNAAAEHQKIELFHERIFNTRTLLLSNDKASLFLLVIALALTALPGRIIQIPLREPK